MAVEPIVGVARVGVGVVTAEVVAGPRVLKKLEKITKMKIITLSLSVFHCLCDTIIFPSFPHIFSLQRQRVIENMFILTTEDRSDIPKIQECKPLLDHPSKSDRK